MTRKDAYKCMNNGLSTHIIIDEIFKSFENKTCINCKYCDETKDTIIHCSKFEQYLPKAMGGCMEWEDKNAN